MVWTCSSLRKLTTSLRDGFVPRCIASQQCMCLNLVCCSPGHSLMMWVAVSSEFSHSLHTLSCSNSRSPHILRCLWRWLWPVSHRVSRDRDSLPRLLSRVRSFPEIFVEGNYSFVCRQVLLFSHLCSHRCCVWLSMMEFIVAFGVLVCIWWFGCCSLPFLASVSARSFPSWPQCALIQRMVTGVFWLRALRDFLQFLTLSDFTSQLSRARIAAWLSEWMMMGLS